MRLLNQFLGFFLILFCFAFSRQQPPSWQLVWDDEFNYEGLPDSTKWGYDIGGGGWGNNEMQYYTANRPENARVSMGHLIIEARKEKWEGNGYTSARLVTKGTKNWKYGKIEVRAMLPKGLGTWPAIWMLGANSPLKWPDDGEIDIMEHVGYDPGIIHASIHCKNYNHIMHTQKTATTKIPDFADNYHLYTLVWDADNIRILIDDKEYFAFSNEHTGYENWPFNQPMYLLLNIAVGGNWGGAKGVDDAIFPQQMLVDYVRVYQQNP